MKPSTSIRYTEQDKILLKKLSEHLGITQTSVVRQAIRLLARKEGIRVQDENVLLHSPTQSNTVD